MGKKKPGQRKEAGQETRPRPQQPQQQAVQQPQQQQGMQRQPQQGSTQQRQPQGQDHQSQGARPKRPNLLAETAPPPPQNAWQRQETPVQRQEPAAQRQQPAVQRQETPVRRPETGDSSVASLTSTLPQLKISDNNGKSSENTRSRGNLRAGRNIEDDYAVKSRPTNLQTKQGQSGRSLVLRANYFKLTDSYDKGLNQYHVTFTPDLETRYKKQIISKNKEKFGGYIFDGTKIYTKLSFNDLEFAEKTASEELVNIEVKFVGKIHLNDFEWLQLYNIIVRRCMDGLKLQLIGRNLFNALQKIELKQYNLEIWPGYITSFRQHERNLLLCCDIIHKVMRHETVHRILDDCRYQASQGRGDFQTLAKNNLLGAVVLTDYNNKTYRIDDIDFGSNPKSLFETRTGNITYFDYYKKRYNITLRDVGQPLLISKPLERTFRSNDVNRDHLIKLVPELCRATGITDAMKNNRNLMTAMATHTRVNPGQRAARLLAFQQDLYKSKESAKVLDEFNIKIDNNLVDIPARILPEPILVFGNNQTISDNYWDQCFKGNTLLQASQLNNWIAVIPNQKSMNIAKDFIGHCQNTGRKMGIRIAHPELIVLPNENTMTYSKILEQACQKDPQIIMIFVSTNRADLYSCIKKKLICDRAVPSQVIRIQTAQRPSGILSVATKVVVQMNIKLRCAPWSVKMPDNCMCIGFDVCHSTRDRTKSYGALVATMDVNLKPGVYFSSVSEHVKGTELSNDIALNVTKALRHYHEQHGKLPTFIFFYRDGVGDGQLHQVYDLEVNNVNKAVEKLYKEFKLTFKMAYIVVSKRINTRLFLPKQGEGYINPPPGTIVDDIITLPTRYDFYLVSQTVRQGTVSPTSYNVLFDNTRIPVDRMQDMTYRQTHIYFNYFATVRVPAVCQYAHKLAFMVGQYLHQSPNNLLEKNLYFL